MTLLICLLVLGTVITGGVSLFLLNRSLLNTIDENLRNSAPAMIRMASESVDDMEQGTAGAEYIPVDFALQIRNNSGDVLFHHVQLEHSIRGDVALPQFTQSELRDRNSAPFTMESGGVRWRAMALELPEDHGGSVLIALPLNTVDATMSEMGLVIMLVGTLVVVLGVGAGTWMVQRALCPLRDMEEAAAAIAAGDLSRRVPVTDTSLEVHSLGTAMNEMLSRIEDAFRAQAASEAKATRSEAKMRRFVGDASHELRTPLAAIRGFGELYRMGALKTEDKVASAMRRIEDEARRMGSLVESLLRLARIDENPNLELSPVDLADALYDAAQDLRALDPTRTVTVTDLAGQPRHASPHQPVGVMGDEEALRQVILNLVGNANRHTPCGSPVEIAVGPSGDATASSPGTITLEVRDHGPGIPEEARDQVFERFFRMDESRQRTATQSGGAGLGLSIAASIVKQHHGSIRVQETPGGGATFLVRLPAAPADAFADHPRSRPDQIRPIIEN